ncbi:MAG: hypothetical protein J5697_01090 [Clostridia bacterium]|nr:hypothetical protein [Clostridia bacterium]
MANKKTREENIRKDKERRFMIANKALFPLETVAAAISILVVLAFFLNWAYVHNTDVGVEVKISGFNTLIAALTGKYSSAENFVGDMAMPFYYYAETYCETLGIYTVIAFFAAVAQLIFSAINLAFALIYKKRFLNYPLAALSVLTAVMITVCFIVALSMKNADILSVYCGGNVKCSIRSLAVIPAILALSSGVLSVVQAVRIRKIKKILK